MKKLKSIHFLVMSIVINLILWLIYYKTSNQDVYDNSFILSCFVVIFASFYILSNFFGFVGKLILKSGIPESRLIVNLGKFLNSSAELISNIIIKGIMLIAIIATIILLIVGAGWIIASLTATTVIIILLVLILLK